MSKENLTKTDRRLQAREKAKELRLAAAKKTKRRKIAAWTSGGLVVVAAAAVVTLVIVSSMKPSVPQTNPKKLASDGIVLTSTTEAIKTEARPVGDLRSFTDTASLPDKPHMNLYIDYSCIHCAEFEEENNGNLQKWLDNGDITLEVHPTAALRTPFSFRGANAAACVVDTAPETFFEFNKKVFESDGAGTAQGVSERGLRNIVENLSISVSNKEKIKSCISDESFSEWVTESTSVALDDKIANNEGTPLTGTPTVLIDGYTYTGSYDSASFVSYVEEFINGNGPTTVTESDTPEVSPVG